MKLFWLTAFLTLACLINLRGGIIVNYDSAEHDRFSSGYPSTPVANGDLLSGAYPSNALDFSGVGWSAGNISNSVALISNRHFVTAKHNRPSGDLNFFNQEGDLITFTIDSNGWHDLYHSNPSNPMSSTISDLHVGTLTVAVTPADKLARYGIAVGNEVDFLGRDLVMYGRSNSSDGSPIIGTNILEGITTISEVPGLSFDDQSRTYITEYNLDIDGDFQAQSGDSGSPTFTVIGNDLVLMGTHLAVGKSNSELAYNDLTYDSFANFYADQIESILANDGEVLSLVAIPEARFLGLVLGLFAMTLTIRRRLDS